MSCDPTLLFLANPSKVSIKSLEQVPRSPPVCLCQHAVNLLYLLIYCKDLIPIVQAYLHEAECPIQINIVYYQYMSTFSLCKHNNVDLTTMPLHKVVLLGSEGKSTLLTRFMLYSKRKEIFNCVMFDACNDQQLRSLTPNCFIYDDLDTECMTRIRNRSRVISSPSSERSVWLLSQGLQWCHRQWGHSESEMKHFMLNGRSLDVHLWISLELWAFFSMTRLSIKQIECVFLDPNFIQSNPNALHQIVSALGWAIFETWEFMSQWMNLRCACWLVVTHTNVYHLHVPQCLPYFRLDHGTMFEVAKFHQLPSIQKIDWTGLLASYDGIGRDTDKE